MSKTQNPPNDTKILVFIGPSGVGKSTLVSELVKQGVIALTPTWTDRPTRKQEIDLEHVFTSPEDMSQKDDEGFFLHEPLTFFGLPYRYALPKVLKTSGAKVPVIMMREAVLKLIRYYYPKAVIYQIEAPKERVEKMLQERAAHGAALGTRLDEYEHEITKGREAADMVFVNDNFQATLEQIKNTIKTDFT